MSSRPLRVLIVDDDDALRDNLSECLEDEGYAVEQARDGAAALERLGGPEAPDAVIVDLLMPGVGGREVVAAVRRRPELRGVRLVVMTGRSAADVDALPGVDLVLEKPFGLDRLLAELEKARPTSG